MKFENVVRLKEDNADKDMLSSFQGDQVDAGLYKSDKLGVVGPGFSRQKALL